MQIPFLITMIFSNIADIISLQFVSVLDTKYIDAVGLGASFIFMIWLVPAWGFWGALDALSSQANGRKDY